MESDIHKLILRYLDGECSDVELRQLHDYFINQDHGDGFEEVVRAYMTQYDESHPDASSLACEVADSVYPHVMKATKPIWRFRWLPYAAAILFIASAIGYFAVNRQKSSLGNFAMGEIAPGSNRATLSLADGRTIDLSSEQAGIVMDDGITYLDGSSVLDESERKGGVEDAQDLAASMLVLTTPKGGTYQVMLPDGSSVWLNAASTLTYPSRFSKDYREVILEGEAFFDINHQPSAIEAGSDHSRHSSGLIPFRVVTRGQTVEVLGTTFNISAYADDDATETTLVEGAVNVLNSQSNAVNRLQPGEQSMVRGAVTKTQKVDVHQHIAWKSGKFSFDGKPLAQVMKEVSRWYNLEVVYQDDIPTERLAGDAFRNQNLSIVLYMLDVLEINYQLDVSSRRLTIYDTKGGQR